MPDAKYKQIWIKALYPFSNFQRKTKVFDDKSSLEQEDYLRYGPFLYKKRCAKEIFINVTDDTIKCMITLIIDLPTLSANSIAMRSDINS